MDPKWDEQLQALSKNPGKWRQGEEEPAYTCSVNPQFLPVQTRSCGVEEVGVACCHFSWRAVTSFLFSATADRFPDVEVVEAILGRRV